MDSAKLARLEFQLVAKLYLLAYLFRLAQEMVNVPNVRLIEHAVCDSFQRQPPALPFFHIEKQKLDYSCKTIPIQNEISFIIGWRFSIDALPGQLLSNLKI